MPLIPDDVIDEIQARVDIAEWIGRYVPLKRAGRHFKAVCPFHKERTPSFHVNTDKQIFHCFGCGVGGNVFGFLMQHDRLSFPEAVRQVAEHTGVPIPEQASHEADGRLEKLIALMEKICGYYERRLADPKYGAVGRAYLDKRGITEASRKAFRLGLAPAGWDGLLKAAQATQVSQQLLEEAGLVLKGSRSFYDRFRNRLIFPIMDARSRVVGFGGRSLDGQDPKYLNSPETPIYYKGRQLYGLAQAKDAIVRQRAVIVVEGYFDCVNLVQGGFTNVVSPLGTALTVEQVRLLKRYTTSVILAFDPDVAGELATLRGIDLLVEAGLEVRVARLPQGVDPDEFLKVRGTEAMAQVLQASISIFDFLVSVAQRRFPMKTTETRVQAAQFILPTLARVPDAMLRSEYVRLLADRLQLDEAAVVEEMKKAGPRQVLPAYRAPKPAQRAKGATQGAERLLVGLVVEEPARWERISKELPREAITDATLARIVRVIEETAIRGSVRAAQVVSHLTDEGLGSLVAALVEEAQTVAYPEEALQDCLQRLKKNHRKIEEDRLREQIRVAQAARQEDTVQELLAAYQDMVKGGV